MKFEWDPVKDHLNQTKHRLGFEEAATVFSDQLALSWEDRVHSVGEYRTLTLGYTERQRLVLVAHTEREGRIRIISAQPASSGERRLYESG
jgi:uncharacterized protein